MIPIKELISEPIVYSCSWEYKSQYDDTKTYVYLTKKKIYEYTYYKKNQGWGYCIYPVKDIEILSSQSIAKNELPGLGEGDFFDVLIYLRHTGELPLKFRFKYSEECAKIAEELILAISKVME